MCMSGASGGGGFSRVSVAHFACFPVNVPWMASRTGAIVRCWGGADQSGQDRITQTPITASGAWPPPTPVPEFLGNRSILSLNEREPYNTFFATELV